MKFRKISKTKNQFSKVAKSCDDSEFWEGIKTNFDPTTGEIELFFEQSHNEISIHISPIS